MFKPNMFTGIYCKIYKQNQLQRYNNMYRNIAEAIKIQHYLQKYRNIFSNIATYKEQSNSYTNIATPIEMQ